MVYEYGSSKLVVVGGKIKNSLRVSYIKMNKDSKSQPVVIKHIKHGEKTEEKIPLSNPLCVPYIPVTVWYGMMVPGMVPGTV